jgi:hypothetical protein
LETKPATARTATMPKITVKVRMVFIGVEQVLDNIYRGRRLVAKLTTSPQAFGFLSPGYLILFPTQKPAARLLARNFVHRGSMKSGFRLIAVRIAIHPS